MGFKKYLTSTLFLALTYNHVKCNQAQEAVQDNTKPNPNKIGDSVIYFRVAAKIDDNPPVITGKERMWCYKDAESYKKSLIHDRATKDSCTLTSGVCHCGDTAGNPCAAQIVVETESTTEDAFDKRMCNGCIYKLKLLDLFEYTQDTAGPTNTAKILTDSYLYIKFYKAVYIADGVTGAKAHILDSDTVDPETASTEIYGAITEKDDKKPLILLESRAMLHFFKDKVGCEITDKGLMVKSTGDCGTGVTAINYPSTAINFGNCNPTDDGTPKTTGCNDLLEAIGKPLWRAEISKTPYGCYTKFRLLPKAYFIEGNEHSGSANPKYQNPCGESFEQDEIADECGSMDEDGDSCIARFRGVSNKDRTKDNKELDDEDLPRNNCGNCYVVRLWTRSVNPHFKIREHHNIEMKVKVYGEASYRDGGEYEEGKRDYRLPMRDEALGHSGGSTVTDVAKVANLTGLNRDIELLWEPVKNSYKNLCKDGNCRLCVDEEVTKLLDADKSDKLRKEINAPAQDPRQTPEYGFKMGETDSDLAGDGFELTESDSKKYKRPFKHFIHIKNDEFGELDYEDGEDECGKGFVEWKEVCFESGSKLRFTSDGGETCGNNDNEKKITITKGGNYRESNVTSDAFAATMMLLVGTENLDGMVVGPCHACSV